MQKKSFWIKSLSLWLIIAIFGACSDSNADPKIQGVVFPDTDYKKVVAYHFEDSSKQARIYRDGELNPTIKKSKELSAEDTRLLLGIVNDRRSYGSLCSDCFNPRLGVVFYNHSNEVIAHLTYCLDCGVQIASPKVKVQEKYFMGNSCLSEEAQIKMQQFCQYLGFGQCTLEE